MNTQKPLYACSEFVQDVCIKWVELPNNNQVFFSLQSLAITKQDAIIISGSIASFFGLIIVFLMVAKGIKSI